MTLEESRVIGEACGLTTIEECYDNILLHYDAFLSIDNFHNDVLEFQKDIFYNEPDEFCKIFNANKEELIEKGWKIKTK